MPAVKATFPLLSSTATIITTTLSARNAARTLLSITQTAAEHITGTATLAVKATFPLHSSTITTPDTESIRQKYIALSAELTT